MSMCNQCGIGILFEIDGEESCLVVRGFVSAGSAAADGRIKKGDILVQVLSHALCLWPLVFLPACLAVRRISLSLVFQIYLSISHFLNTIIHIYIYYMYTHTHTHTHTGGRSGYQAV